jgi:hypothetical protein
MAITVKRTTSIKVVKTALGVMLLTHLPEYIVVTRDRRRIGYIVKRSQGWIYTATNRYGTTKAEGGHFATKLHALEALIAAYIECCEDAFYNHPD